MPNREHTVLPRNLDLGRRQGSKIVCAALRHSYLLIPERCLKELPDKLFYCLACSAAEHWKGSILLLNGRSRDREMSVPAACPCDGFANAIRLAKQCTCLWPER